MAKMMQSRSEENLKEVYSLARKNHQPLNVLFQIIQECNLKCQFCYVHEEDGRDQLSFSEIRRILSEMKKAGTLFVTLTGGEPMKRRDFFEVCEEVKKQGMMFLVKTNGTYLTPENTEKLAKLLPFKVSISFHGADCETHDVLTQVRGSFDRALNAAKALTAKGVLVQFNYPVSKLNGHQVRELHEMAEKHGVAYVMDPKIVVKENGDKSPVNLRAGNGAIKEVFRMQIEQRVEAGGMLTCEELPKLDNELNKDFSCSAGRTLAYVNSKGEVFPCVRYPVKSGDCREKEFGEIWTHSPKFEELRNFKSADLHTCKTCNLQGYCSRCPGDALVEYGDEFGPSEVACHEAALKQEVYHEYFGGNH